MLHSSSTRFLSTTAHQQQKISTLMLNAASLSEPSNKLYPGVQYFTHQLMRNNQKSSSQVDDEPNIVLRNLLAETIKNKEPKLESALFLPRELRRQNQLTDLMEKTSGIGTRNIPTSIHRRFHAKITPRQSSVQIYHANNNNNNNNNINRKNIINVDDDKMSIERLNLTLWIRGTSIETLRSIIEEEISKKITRNSASSSSSVVVVPFSNEEVDPKSWSQVSFEIRVFSGGGEGSLNNDNNNKENAAAIDKFLKEDPVFELSVMDSLLKINKKAQQQQVEEPWFKIVKKDHQKRPRKKKTVSTNSSSSVSHFIKLSNIRDNASSLQHKVENFFDNGFANFFGPERFIMLLPPTQSAATAPLSSVSSSSQTLLFSSTATCFSLLRTFHVHQLLRRGEFREAATVIAMMLSFQQQQQSSKFVKEFLRAIAHPSLQTKQSAFSDLILTELPTTTLLQILTSLPCLEWNLAASHVLQENRGNIINNNISHSSKNAPQQTLFDTKWERANGTNSTFLQLLLLNEKSSSVSDEDPNTELMMRARSTLLTSNEYSWSSSDSSFLKQLKGHPLHSKTVENIGLENVLARNSASLFLNRPLIVFPEQTRVNILPARNKIDDENEGREEEAMMMNEKNDIPQWAQDLMTSRTKDVSKTRTTTTGHGVREIALTMNVPNGAYLSSALREFCRVE